jgi:hypothetical protein
VSTRLENSPEVNAAILVLYRPGDPIRDANWAHARRTWNRHGYQPVTAPGTAGLYQARNQAARRALDWDVALFADADMLIGQRQAREALDTAYETGRYVCAYDRFAYLSRRGRLQALHDKPLAEADRIAERWGLWIGCFAIRRDSFDLLGGFDERFAGRKGQDVCFLHAATTLLGKQRIPGTAYHLWHPRPAIPQPGAPDLWEAYKRATGDPERMHRLLEPLRSEPHAQAI